MRVLVALYRSITSHFFSDHSSSPSLFPFTNSQFALAIVFNPHASPKQTTVLLTSIIALPVKVPTKIATTAMIFSSLARLSLRANRKGSLMREHHTVVRTSVVPKAVFSRCKRRNRSAAARRRIGIAIFIEKISPLTTPIIPCNPVAALINANVANPHPVIQDGSFLALLDQAMHIHQSLSTLSRDLSTHGAISTSPPLQQHNVATNNIKPCNTVAPTNQPLVLFPILSPSLPIPVPPIKHVNDIKACLSGKRKS